MSPLGLVIVIALILLLFGGIAPTFWAGAPYRYGYGYNHGGIGIIGIILIIIVILALLGHLPF